MHALLDGIPLDEMNTSMTINATAAWLLALYMTVAEENGVDMPRPPGHHPERHHQGVPLARDLRVPARALDAADRGHDRLHASTRCRSGTRSTSAPTTSRRRGPRRSRRSPTRSRPRWPCSTACAQRVPEETFPRVFGRLSFFVNAGIRFVEEHAKLRAMGRLWEELGRERYGVEDPKLLRFRYGVQVNSLGLTESQPENNIIRIVLEALAVTMGRDARARALQLPAWNEALGLPRPVGPAVVAADPADPGLRDRPARLPGHLRGLEGDGRPRGRADRGRPRGDGRGGRARRRRGGGART